MRVSKLSLVIDLRNLQEARNVQVSSAREVECMQVNVRKKWLLFYGKMLRIKAVVYPGAALVSDAD